MDTGRQLFESDSTLAQSEQLDEGDEVVEVDESLFQGLALADNDVDDPNDDEDRSFLYED